MFGLVFKAAKIFGTVCHGAGTVMAGTAVLTTSAIMKGKEASEKREEEIKREMKNNSCN